MALFVSGQQCELREVKLADKPPELLQASPKATVPVLQLATGKVLDESLAIMRWALEQNDPESWLSGFDQALIDQNDGPFKHHLDRYKYATRHDSDPAEHRAAAVKILEQLNTRLESQTELCGDQSSLTDIAIFPFIRQFANADRAWFDGQDLPHLQDWLGRHLASTLFANIMEKHKVWENGDYETFP